MNLGIVAKHISFLQSSVQLLKEMSIQSLAAIIDVGKKRKNKERERQRESEREKEKERERERDR